LKTLVTEIKEVTMNTKNQDETVQNQDNGVVTECKVTVTKGRMAMKLSGIFTP
jgi:hypothetical protein